MRLMMFEKGQGAALGLVEGQLVIDLAAVEASLPKDLKSLIAAGPRVSPAITTRFVVASVSHATRTWRGSQPCRGARSKKASTTSSEMRSHTLSGWPSETDSLVNR